MPLLNETSPLIKSSQKKGSLSLPPQTQTQVARKDYITTGSRLGGDEESRLDASTLNWRGNTVASITPSGLDGLEAPGIDFLPEANNFSPENHHEELKIEVKSSKCRREDAAAGDQSQKACNFPLI